jgi:hypothetical protein
LQAYFLPTSKCHRKEKLKYPDIINKDEKNITSYFEELDHVAVKNFISRHSNQRFEKEFLQHFTYQAHNKRTILLKPPFINSYQSLAKDPDTTLQKIHQENSFTR